MTTIGKKMRMAGNQMAFSTEICGDGWLWQMTEVSYEVGKSTFLTYWVDGNWFLQRNPSKEEQVRVPLGRTL